MIQPPAMAVDFPFFKVKKVKNEITKKKAYLGRYATCFSGLLYSVLLCSPLF